MMLRRGDSGTEEELADDALDRRALEIVQRCGCDWDEAWMCAATQRADRGDRHRRARPGRTNLSEQVGVPPPRPSRGTPGRTTLSAQLVFRRAETDALPHQDARARLEAAARNSGEKLPEAIRAQLERALGTDLEAVRVHTDTRSAEAASAIHASAYSVGSHIHFAAGRFDPTTPGGVALLAHEVAHTVQQGGRGELGSGDLQLSSTDDHHEIDAERFAAEFQANGAQAESRRVDAPGTPNAGRGPTLPATAAPADVIHRSPAQTTPAPANDPQPALGAKPSVTSMPTAPPRAVVALAATASATPGTKPAASAKPATPATRPAKPPKPATTAKPTAGPAKKTSPAPANTNAPKPRGAPATPAPSVAAASPATGSSPAAVPAMTPPPSAAGPANAGAAILIAQIQAAGQAGKQRITQQLSTSAAAINASIAQQKQSLAAMGVTQRAEIRAQIAAARAEAASSTSAAKAKLTADGAAKSAAATASGAPATAKATAATTDREGKARTVGDAAAARATQHGQAKTAATRTTVESLAHSARDAGASRANIAGKNADATTGKRQAATQLAGDTAEGVLGNLSALLGGVTSAVTEAATSLRQKAGEVADAIGQHMPEVITHIGEGAAAAASGIGELVSGAVGALSEMVGSLNDKLGELEQHSLSDLDHALATKQAELDRSGQQATTAMREQGTAAQAAADQQVAEATAEVGHRELTAEQARTGGAEVTVKMNAAFDGLLAKIIGAEGQLCGTIAQVGGDAVATLSTYANSVGAEARKVTSRANAKAQEHTATVQGQTQTAAARAQHETTAIADGHAAAMDQAVDHARTEINAKQGEVAGKIDGQVSADVGRVRGPVDSLAGRISGAQNEIDNRSAWDSFVGFLSSIGSWLKGQWHDFVEIISDWGFWAGLVVGILASFVVGPVAGAMIGAAVGTIVSNVTAKPPRPWHENVLKNMLIGGLFTAALVIAVAAAVYAGASALVVFIVVEVVTIIGTIIINAVNGDRWDRGLLANMFIIGLLHVLFAKFMPRVAVKPGETEVPPERPPGEPNPEKPPEAPSTAAPRTFADLLGRLSAKAQEAVAQQRQLRSAANMQDMENIGRNPDGTYDVTKANGTWERMWMDEARFKKAMEKQSTEQAAKAQIEVDRIKNVCDENDGTNRENASVGDGSTEAALKQEARTGEPVKGKAHAGKAQNAVNTLTDAVRTLERINPMVSDPTMTARIDAAITRANARIARLQGGLDVWNARATLFPKVWFADGTPRPKLPPAPPPHNDDDQPEGGTPP